MTRGPEVALRLSLGARRSAVARRLLDDVLPSGLGLVAGLGFAAGIAALLPRLLVTGLAILSADGIDRPKLRLDWRVFLFACVLSLLTMVLLALVPLMQAARSQLLPVLQAAAVSRTAVKTSVFRRAAIWLQIAVSFALLVSTGALVRGFVNTRTQSIGLTTESSAAGPDAGA